MDEAGRGSVTEEPIFVVAAAIVNPDTQWHALRQHYVDLANDVFDPHFDDEYLDEYVFHAKDVWHGSGDFPRQRYSRAERMRILGRLAQVPALYNVPICIALIDRRGIQSPLRDDKDGTLFAHVRAYSGAMQYVDTWMERHCPGEVAEIKVEHTDKVRTAIGYIHEGAKKRDQLDPYFDRGMFITKNIIEAVGFMRKNESPVLQIADHCAFLAKRTATGCPHVKSIWKFVWPQVQTANLHKDSKVLMRLPREIIEPVD
jgi:hypothetical protein